MKVRVPAAAMNVSALSSPPAPAHMAGFTPGSVTRAVTKKADALPTITVIVGLFVLLAVLIIVLVRYGSQLRVLQLTLRHEPMPQDLEHGVRLTDWKKLGSTRKSSTQPAPSFQGEPGSHAAATWPVPCSCAHQPLCGNAEPNVIEISYL
ncbi:small integral membrane protein 33 [Pelodiscus sinensis]|uniref:small integral membrane protein 33 n=1 Tax=Pelodiscus sinensis TaxID=13735 RepID=UPI003F6ABE71